MENKLFRNKVSRGPKNPLPKIKDVGLSSFRLYNRKDHRFENLTEDEYENFLNIKSNKDIIIPTSDKGNSVAVIDR